MGTALERASAIYDISERASSYDMLGSFIAMPIGQLAWGPLGIVFGNERVLVASGIDTFSRINYGEARPVSLRNAPVSASGPARLDRGAHSHISMPRNYPY